MSTDSASARLAMWSGPRNISTALMRSWENRPDCIVVDEPLYAHYLAVTGIDHPGRDEVLATGTTDWRAVVDGLLAPLPDGVAVFYQKQMAHHLTPDVDHDWMRGLTNVLLIRDPAEVVASYLRSRAEVAVPDIGLLQQEQLYDEMASWGDPPPVIDAADFLRAPAAYLRMLCSLAHVDFDERMLSWPSGPRDSDGVWAPYWYAAVWASTGLTPYRPRAVDVPPEGADVVRACRPAYERLHALRLRTAE